MITSPEHGITLGDLALMSDGQPVTHAAGFTTEVSADGTTWGNPAVAVSSLISELSDGEIVSQQRTGNREPVLYVRISADDHSGLVAGDTALSLVVGKACELVWTPPGPSAPMSVIEVVHSRMDHQWDDWDELHYRRVWVISMAALPWVRSADKVITPAVTPASPVVVDSGSSTTNWTAPWGPTGATVTVVSGAVTATYNAALLNNRPFFPYYGTALRRASLAVNTAADKYLAVDWKSSIAGYYFVLVNGATTALTEVRREPSGVAGVTRSWYHVGDITLVTTLDVVYDQTVVGSGTQTFAIDQILQANALPSPGTTRQKMSAIFPGGSVPAEGDIRVQHATDTLSKTLVYTHPVRSGYSPPLRPWLTSTSPAPISNAGMVSGFYNDLTAPMVFSVPIDALPNGSAHLWIKMGADSTSAARLNWSVTAWQGGVAQVGGRQSGSLLVAVPSVGPHYVFPIARVTLPPSAVTGPNGYVVFIVERDASSSGIGITVDELWAFAMDEGALTVVDAGEGAVTSGLSANRLRVSAPSLSAPYGELRVATAADWSDAWEPAATNIQCDQRNHRFDPNGSMIFTVTTGTLGADVSLEHYRRWRAEAGD